MGRARKGGVEKAVYEKLVFLGLKETPTGIQNAWSTYIGSLFVDCGPFVVVFFFNGLSEFANGRGKQKGKVEIGQWVK